MLSCRQVAVGTDCGDVVLVAGRHEGQTVGVDLMAGCSVCLSHLLLTLTQLPITQRLQHLSTDLHKHKHSQLVDLDYCGHVLKQNQQVCGSADVKDIITDLDAFSRQ